jgi:hypothetical protein
VSPGSGKTSRIENGLALVMTQTKCLVMVIYLNFALLVLSLESTCCQTGTSNQISKLTFVISLAFTNK